MRLRNLRREPLRHRTSRARSFVGSAILLVIATITLFSIAWNEIVNFDPDNLGGRHIDRLAVELIEITDIILLGTVLYIVALGLYQLFIDQNLPCHAG